MAYRRLYGISIAEVESMYKEQSGLCPICLTSLPDTPTRACVDHEHRTNKVRALLCRKCNMLVGVEENNPGTYNRLLGYLEHYNAVQVASPGALGTHA